MNSRGLLVFLFISTLVTTVAGCADSDMGANRKASSESSEPTTQIESLPQFFRSGSPRCVAVATEEGRSAVPLAFVATS
jgi:hypothetical protein